MKKFITKAATSTANFVKDSATGMLGTVHFLAISTADVCEKVECRIHREIDPEQVRKDRMMHTLDMQQSIIDLADKIMLRGKEAKEYIVSTTTSMTPVYPARDLDEKVIIEFEATTNQ